MENNNKNCTSNTKMKNIKKLDTKRIKNIHTKSAVKNASGMKSNLNQDKASMITKLSCLPSTSKSTPNKNKLIRKNVVKKQEVNANEKPLRSILKTPGKEETDEPSTSRKRKRHLTPKNVSYANTINNKNPKLDTPGRSILKTPVKEETDKLSTSTNRNKQQTPKRVKYENNVNNVRPRLDMPETIKCEYDSDLEISNDHTYEEIDKSRSKIFTDCIAIPSINIIVPNSGTINEHIEEEIHDVINPTNAIIGNDNKTSLTLPVEDPQNQINEEEHNLEIENFLNSFTFSPEKQRKPEEEDNSYLMEDKKGKNEIELVLKSQPSTSSIILTEEEEMKIENGNTPKMICKEHNRSKSNSRNQSTTPEGKLEIRQNSNSFVYNSPPVIIHNFVSKMGGNKMSEVLIYKLGSQSTPRKIRKDNVSRNSWGTPETNFVSLRNSSLQNIVAKKTLIKNKINKYKVDNIPSALVKPINIKSLKPLKNRQISKKVIEKRNPFLSDETESRKVTQEVYSIIPVKSLISKFENIISGEPKTDDSKINKLVKIKIRRTSFDNEPISPKDLPDKLEKVAIASLESSDSPAIVLGNKLQSETLVNSCKRKFSFSDEEEKEELNVDNLVHKTNSNSPTKMNVFHKIRCEVVSKEDYLFQSPEVIPETKTMKNQENISPIKSDNDRTNQKPKETKNSDVLENNSFKKDKTSVVLQDSGFSETKISHDSKCESNSSELISLFPICDKIKSNSNDFTDISFNDSLKEVIENVTEENPNDSGQFLLDNEGSNTPTSSVAMLFSIAESLVNSPMSYSEYRTEFQKRLSLKNSSVI